MLNFEMISTTVSTSNHMFDRSIWDKLSECIFEKNNKTYDYWLITRRQQTLCIETNIF